MADTMRWRYGDTCPVTLPVDSTTVIEIGDLVYLDTDDAKPAGAIDNIGGGGPANLAAAQEVFHDAFVGVAMQRSRNGDTQPIRIATGGVFELACASATLELGTRVGLDDNAGGTALESQQVIAVAAGSPQLAVGRVARRVNPADTKVLVEIHSTILRDGPQAVA
jgi:hypothetical protein